MSTARRKLMNRALIPFGPRRLWTDEEIAIALQADLPPVEVARLIGRSYLAVQHKRATLWRERIMPQPIRAHAKKLRKYPRAASAA